MPASEFLSFKNVLYLFLFGHTVLTPNIQLASFYCSLDSDES